MIALQSDQSILDELDFNPECCRPRHKGKWVKADFLVEQIPTSNCCKHVLHKTRWICDKCYESARVRGLYCRKCNVTVERDEIWKVVGTI